MTQISVFRNYSSDACLILLKNVFGKSKYCDFQYGAMD